MFNYSFIGGNFITLAKSGIYPLKPTISINQKDWSKSGTSDGRGVFGVRPAASYEGNFFETDLYFSENENATKDQMIKIKDAVCSVNRQKNIVKTSLVGLSGTIKEYINMGDYDITINFGIVATSGDGELVDEYPTDGVEAFRRFFELNKSVFVVSDFLGIFEITRIVLTDISIPQETWSNVQQVTVKAVSDDDYEIKCNEY